jgi:WbqC-like protein family
MKSIAIMQPYFFPYIGYFQLIHAVDRFVIYDDVNYIMRGWINRNRILINGIPNYIIVPLQQASQNKRISDISIEASPAWRNKIIRSIENTYRKAPYFTEVFAIVDNLIRYETDNLSDYLAYQLRMLSTFMGIKTEFVVTSRCYENSELTSQARILDICKHETVATYINPEGGQELYSKEQFKSGNINLKFLKATLPEYRQFSNEFVPGLSIIDVMMFNSPDEINKMLNEYELL